MKRRPFLLTSLVFLLLTPILIWGAGALTHYWSVGQLALESEHQLRRYVQGLTTTIQLNEYAAALTGFQPEVMNLLRDPADKALRQQANAALERLQGRLHAGVLYVMGRSGETLAASNWRETGSFVGKNYAFRPYFKKAITGTRAYYIGIGATSGKPGFYVSEPIQIDGEVVAVAVVKDNLERHRLLSADIEKRFITTGGDGVVFLSSEDRWRYTTTRPLTEERRRQITASRQYADIVLRAFPVRSLAPFNGVTDRVALADASSTDIPPAGAAPTHLSQSAFLLGPGWEVHIFSSLTATSFATQIARGGMALFCLVVYLGALFLLQRRLYIQELRDAAIYDQLTGLHTRRYMVDAVNTQISRLERGMVDALAGVMLDIDHFKRINDNYGHSAGDRVLQAIGQAIKQNIRHGDVAVRYGGEEFTIVLGMKNEERAMAGIERIRHAIHAIRFAPPMENETITVSAGIAHHAPGESLDQLLARADKLLYQAKREGRDRICADRMETIPTQGTDECA